MIHIGIAEDHALIRHSLIALLHDQKFCLVVINACNGADLINQLQVCKTVPDVIILDLVMPVMTGKEAARLLKSDYPAIKIIVLSFIHHEHTRIETLGLGVTAFITKDCEPQDLINAIYSAMNNDLLLEEMGETYEKRHHQYRKHHTPDVFSPLTQKQVFFLMQCAIPDLSYKEIANKLNLSLNTVHRYREDLFKKLNVNSRAGLALYAIRNGIVAI